MKKIFLILGIILIISIGGYLYLRFSVLKTKVVKEDVAKEKTVLDLRPALIAKIQDLVKTGSSGLYNLNIDKIEPHVILSKLEMQNVSLTPDTAVLRKMNLAHTAPDDIFKISFSDLHIEGIGIDDLLHKDEIDLKSVVVSNPVIEVFHTKRPYNAALRKMKDTMSLYHRLLHKLKKISVDKISLQHGSLITHNLSNKNKRLQFNYVEISLADLLVDSSTQYDKNRFLFARQTEFSCKNYSFPTPDSLYMFKIGTMTVSGVKHSLVATNVVLSSRWNKVQFKQRLHAMKEMYDIQIPKLTLSNIDWWSLLNHESFIANEGNIDNAKVDIFLDRSMPDRKVKTDNFPSQVLMRAPIPILIKKIYLNNMNFSYGEYNPSLDKTGYVYIDKINGSANNITNMRSQLNKNTNASLSGTGLFMHKTKMKATFNLSLKNYKTGEFTADVNMGPLDTAMLNPITEPLGGFEIKRGTMQSGEAHVKGNNLQASGTGVILYQDLHITPLKKSDKTASGLKAKTFTSFFANLILIKNNNPSNGKSSPRNVEAAYDRKSYTTFFNLVWKTILTGILKTIGVPKKFANKS